LIKRHPSGALEIHTDKRLLVLTEDEYLSELSRGRGIERKQAITGIASNTIGEKKNASTSRKPRSADPI